MVALLLTVGTAPAVAATAATPAITWAACTGLPGPADLECGTLTAPLDYDDPDGKTIDLAVLRAKAGGDRLGSLVFNFGGPGAPAVETLAAALGSYTELRERYDLVAIDPRGVGRSSPITCGTTAELDRYFATDGSISKPAERPKILAATKKYIDACVKNSGEILPHVGTPNVARDLDRLRTALGEDKLDFLGYSYGTMLGATFATLYPRNVGRMVLDAAADMTQPYLDMAEAGVAGREHTYRLFLDDCVKNGCDLGTTTKAANRTVERLVNRLKATPLQVGERQLSGALATMGVAIGLYTKSTWPIIESAVSKAVKGDGRELLALSDVYTGRSPNGRYSTMLQAAFAVACRDAVESPTLRQTIEADRRLRKVSPLFGGGSPMCAMWPVPAQPNDRIDATGSGPIVVIGGKADPATPYEWAESMARKLKTGVLVTFEGEGHGSFGQGNTCVDALVHAYYFDGTVPAPGSSCPAG
ncbi:alpha/beta hydrolase [Nonomuraea antimicrobica]|uniref:Alpha/beta hydrolase n=2 Tax=Nonomuraea antimicrobica TaxID=561173 RepID=A0ABP7BQF0_9ACTN